MLLAIKNLWDTQGNFLPTECFRTLELKIELLITHLTDLREPRPLPLKLNEILLLLIKKKSI
jgi:hypothetical protein